MILGTVIHSAMQNKLNQDTSYLQVTLISDLAQFELLSNCLGSAISMYIKPFRKDMFRKRIRPYVFVPHNLVLNGKEMIWTEIISLFSALKVRCCSRL